MITFKIINGQAILNFSEAINPEFDAQCWRKRVNNKKFLFSQMVKTLSPDQVIVLGELQ